MLILRRAITTACAAFAIFPALADAAARADAHGPIGVMDEHYHERGEWMFSYRFMTMSMEGNRQGSGAIATETIATTEPNPFAGQPGQPPTLRIVPLEMRTDTHRLGVMFAPTDRITLAAVTAYTRKSADHVTYRGSTGTDVLGTFTARSSGLTDTSVSALLGIVDHPQSKFHIIAGLSLPTGETGETDGILTPADTEPSLRLPYPLQHGSGTVDPLIGANYLALLDRWSWGGQWRSTLRGWDNDDDYHLGNEHRLTGWVSYLWNDAASASLRLEHYRRENISGADPQIVAPLQAADPDRQKTRLSELGIGLNWAGTGLRQGYRLALEYLVPIHQDVTGPQLERDARIVLGFRKTW